MNRKKVCRSPKGYVLLTLGSYLCPKGKSSWYSPHLWGPTASLSIPADQPASFRKGTGVYMARESRWSEEGLDLHLAEDEDGTWGAALIDPSGKTLWSRGGYKDQKNAQTGASAWIRKTYGAHTPQKPAPRKPAPVTGSPMVVMLRRKAEENAKEVVRLRHQADLLEEEAKRLDMAADVLAGPEEPEEEGASGD